MIVNVLDIMEEGLGFPLKRNSNTDSFRQGHKILCVLKDPSFMSGNGTKADIISSAPKSFNLIQKHLILFGFLNIIRNLRYMNPWEWCFQHL